MLYPGVRVVAVISNLWSTDISLRPIYQPIFRTFQILVLANHFLCSFLAEVFEDFYFDGAENGSTLAHSAPSYLLSLLTVLFNTDISPSNKQIEWLNK